MRWNYHLRELQSNNELPNVTVAESKVVLTINLVHGIQIQVKGMVKN
jgi:hypothetical protein